MKVKFKAEKLPISPEGFPTDNSVYADVWKKAEEYCSKIPEDKCKPEGTAKVQQFDQDLACDWTQQPKMMIHGGFFMPSPKALVRLIVGKGCYLDTVGPDVHWSERPTKKPKAEEPIE